MQQHGWLSQHFTPPAKTEMAGDTFMKPPPKAPPLHEIGPHMVGVRSNAEFDAFLHTSKPGTAVVEFGTSWCVKCHEMFPKFYQLSKQYSQHKYAVAQVEHMKAPLASIRYTPTFGIFRNGVKVDEVIGKEPQKLEDHLWLHSD